MIFSGAFIVMDNIVIYRLPCNMNYQRFIIYYYKNINKYRWVNWVSGHNTGEIIKSSGNAIFHEGKLLLQKTDTNEIENSFTTLMENKITNLL